MEQAGALQLQVQSGQLGLPVENQFLEISGQGKLEPRAERTVPLRVEAEEVRADQTLDFTKLTYNSASHFL